MFYKLYKNSTEELLKYPESGMGYQIIETNLPALPSYEKEILLVINAELAIAMDNDFESELKTITSSALPSILQKAPLINLKTLKVFNPGFINQVRNLAEDKGKNYDKSATDNDSENANGDELFVRLSAFQNDRRIDKHNKCLLPGSFTTTASDALKCRIGKNNPNERYALPNELNIEWTFYIEPKPSDKLQRGIVQKDFGKEGGGREVYFEKGTSNNTFITEYKW